MKKLQEICIGYVGGMETILTKNDTNLEKVLRSLTTTLPGEIAIIPTRGRYLYHTLYINPAYITIIDCAYGTDEEYEQAEAENT